MLPLRETHLLVKEVKSRPMLWDTSNPFYRDKARKSQAWKEITHIVYPETAGSNTEGRRLKELMSRWKSLRDSYSKHLKRHLLYGEESALAKPYMFASKLTFLDNYMTFRDVVSVNGNGPNSNNSNGVHTSNGAPNFQSKEEVIDDNEEEEEEDLGDDQNSTTLDFECEDELMDGIRLEVNDSDSDSPAEDFHEATASTSANSAAVSVPPPIRTAAFRDRFRTTVPSTRGKQIPKPQRDFGKLEEMMARVVRREKLAQQDPDEAYFVSLLPNVRSLTMNQKLEFRTEVLLLLRSIMAGSSRTERNFPAAAAASPGSTSSTPS